MFCVQYVNDHSRKFLSAYEEHYIFSLSVLVQSVFCPYYVLLLCRLLPVPNFSLFLFCFTCSFLALKGNNPLTLACIFLSTLYLFCPKPLSKKIQPLFLFALIRVGHNYYCLFMFVVISILFFAYFIFALTLQLNYSTF